MSDTTTTASSTRRRAHPIAYKTYLPRTLIFIGFALLIAVSTLPENLPWVIAAAVINLLYPHVGHYYASNGEAPQKRAIDLMRVDAVVVGFNIAVMSFRWLPSMAMFTILLGTLLLMGGLRFARYIAFTVGAAALGLLFFDFTPLAPVDFSTELLVYLLVVSYIMSMAYTSNRTTKDAIEARQQLHAQNEQITEQSETLAAVNEITRAVNASLRLDDVVQAVMAGLQQIFSFDLMGVALIDDEQQRLVLDREVGSGHFDMEKLKSLSIDLDDPDSFFARAIRSRESVYFPRITARDASRMPAADRAVYEAAPSKSLLIVPLIVEERVIGTISFSNSATSFRLDRHSIQRIEKYVSQLATAVRNARLFEETREARRAALAATEAKSQFLANMSHELRTPMNAVIGYSEMLEEEAEDEGLTDFIPDLKKIQAAGKHLLELINGILDLSKVEASKMELYLEDADVGQLIEGVASTVKPLVAKNENLLLLERDEDLGQMHADVTKIRQSLLNLLSNASKFTEKGEVRLEARRETGNGEDWLRFSVTDTGIGMTEEQLGKLFQPFTQADASTTRKYGGTGLGLTISKRFCEMMGGDITVTSVPGQGSTFTMRVPAVVADTGGQ